MAVQSNGSKVNREPNEANGAAKVSQAVSDIEQTDIKEQVHNLETPDNHFQIFQTSLFEHDFKYEDSFVSASLQRLHHGIYTHGRLKIQGSPSQVTHVTFVAITFVFQPMHSSECRFKRAQLSVQAYKALKNPPQATDQPLRILKFAPHLGYGRISTETFIGRATMGVTTPLTANVTPSSSFDKAKVVDSMLKIQGSTRTAEGVQSSKLVWSMEENDMQNSGLPREFTFVFLVEQPVAQAPFTLQIGIKPVFSYDIEGAIKKVISHNHGEIIARSGILSEEVGQTFSQSPFNFATMTGRFEDLVELPENAVNIRDLSSTKLDAASASATTTAAFTAGTN